MSGPSRRAPTTFGELRTLLAERGDPWQPDPSLSDDEPLPEYPTGGDGVYEPPDRELPEGDLDELLRRHPPAHPDLQAVWSEEGLLETPEPGTGG